MGAGIGAESGGGAIPCGELAQATAVTTKIKKNIDTIINFFM